MLAAIIYVTPFILLERKIRLSEMAEKQLLFVSLYKNRVDTIFTVLGYDTVEDVVHDFIEGNLMDSAGNTVDSLFDIHFDELPEGDSNKLWKLFWYYGHSEDESGEGWWCIYDITEGNPAGMRWSPTEPITNLPWTEDGG